MLVNCSGVTFDLSLFKQNSVTPHKWFWYWHTSLYVCLICLIHAHGTSFIIVHWIVVVINSVSWSVRTNLPAVSSLSDTAQHTGCGSIMKGETVARIFDSKMDEMLWVRNTSMREFPNCSLTVAPPPAKCVVCVENQQVYAVCGELLENTTLDIEGTGTYTYSQAREYHCKMAQKYLQTVHEQRTDKASKWSKKQCFHFTL